MTPRITTAEVTFASAALISPSPSAAAAPVDREFTLSRVRQMLDGCGTGNRNDLLVIAISALIHAGVNTRGAIVGAAVSLGFKREHAGAVLSSSTGANPARHQWRRGSDGVYAALG